MNMGFEVVAAKPKGLPNEDEPQQQPMRADRKISRNPSTDQKKVRRQMARQQRRTAAKVGFEVIEDPLYDWPDDDKDYDSFEDDWPIGGDEAQQNDNVKAWPVNYNRGPQASLQEERDMSTRREAQLLEAMRYATLDEQAELAQELVDLRAARAAAIQAERETDLSQAVIAEAMTPVRVHEINTTATDWLHEIEPVETGNVTQAMATEASMWFRRTSAEVKADREEFSEQAQGYARRVAGQFGEAAPVAQRAFLDHVAHLYRTGGQVTADDKPGRVDENQSGNAESEITDYDTDGNDDEAFDEKLNGELAPTGPVEVSSDRAPVIQENKQGSFRTALDIVKCKRCGGNKMEGRRCQHCNSGGQRSKPYRGTASLQATAANCAQCGASIERDPAGEEPRTWHHNDGSNHDHEAKPAEGDGKESSLRVIAARPLYEIAREIRADWKNVYFGAVPYLDALRDLDSISDSYGADPAAQIVAYFLSNASAWRGETARRIKAELNAMLKTAIRRQATYYCNTHDVYVGDGNRDSHAGCKLEQRKKADSLLHEADSQNGQGKSSLEDVEVGDEDDRPMWPWELGDEVKNGDGAADVSNVRTPGGEAGYPQPKRGAAELPLNRDVVQDACQVCAGTGYGVLFNREASRHERIMCAACNGVGRVVLPFVGRPATTAGQAEPWPDSSRGKQNPSVLPWGQDGDNDGERHRGHLVATTFDHSLDTVADRSDYAHWNEDADHMWWQEEGRHGYEPPEDDPYDNPEYDADFECPGCGEQLAGDDEDGVIEHWTVCPHPKDLLGVPGVQDILENGGVDIKAASKQAAVMPTPRCPICGESGAMDVDPGALSAWRSGAFIQYAFPNLSAGEREQLKTGIHPACWEKLYGTTGKRQAFKSAIQRGIAASRHVAIGEDDPRRGQPTTKSSEWCRIEPLGTDTNGDEWNICEVHGYEVLGDAYVCEGYTAPPYTEAMRKGAPFAGYEDFDACVAANSDKDDPEAYCGKIKHQVEDKKTSALIEPCRNCQATGEVEGRTCAICEGKGETDAYSRDYGNPDDMNTAPWPNGTDRWAARVGPGPSSPEERCETCAGKGWTDWPGGGDFDVPGLPMPTCQVCKGTGIRKGASRKVAASPGWLHERNNDPYGTPGNHPFWDTVDFEDHGEKRIFEKDGTWYGHHRRQNYWMTFRSGKSEALEWTQAENLDMWASKTAAPQDEFYLVAGEGEGKHIVSGPHTHEEGKRLMRESDEPVSLMQGSHPHLPKQAQDYSETSSIGNVSAYDFGKAVAEGGGSLLQAYREFRAYTKGKATKRELDEIGRAFQEEAASRNTDPNSSGIMRLMHLRSQAFRDRCQASLRDKSRGSETQTLTSTHRPDHRHTAATHEAMPNPVDLGVKVGDIFYSSWGYDQTNVDFYEVVGLTGASVKVREVYSDIDTSKSEQGADYVTPRRGDFRGGAMTKRIQQVGGRPCFSVASYATAFLWDGKPRYQTPSGMGH